MRKRISWRWWSGRAGFENPKLDIKQLLLLLGIGCYSFEELENRYQATAPIIRRCLSLFNYKIWSGSGGFENSKLDIKQLLLLLGFV
ncbi:hypothetical protein NL676_038177 [Syzygium grande]|nr:hypothetical protein NL676_038177 [Syzygium grande]